MKRLQRRTCQSSSSAVRTYSDLRGMIISNPGSFSEVVFNPGKRSITAIHRGTVAITSAAVNLVAMPLFHIGGGGWACVGLTAGCEDVIVREIDPAAIAKVIEDRKVTRGHRRRKNAGAEPGPERRHLTCEAGRCER